MLTLQILPQTFAVCKIESLKAVDFDRTFLFLGKTEDEISLVCEIDAIPGDATDIEKEWRAFKVSGTLDFGLVGIIAGISAALAAEGISLFVVSTYNTDYVLVKTDAFERAVDCLSAAGYAVVEEG